MATTSSIGILLLLSGILLFGTMFITLEPTGGLIWFTTHDLSIIKTQLANQCAPSPSTHIQTESDIRTCCSNACTRFGKMRQLACTTRCLDWAKTFNL